VSSPQKEPVLRAGHTTAALVVVTVVSVSVDDDSDLDGSAVSDWCADQFSGPESYTRL
jgi:hypothetical protein